MAFPQNRPLWQFSSLELGLPTQRAQFIFFFYFVIAVRVLSEMLPRMECSFLPWLPFNRSSWFSKRKYNRKTFSIDSNLVKFVIELWSFYILPLTCLERSFYFMSFCFIIFSKNAATYFILICYSLFIVVFFLMIHSLILNSN